MVSGLNSDVRREGVVYHVQTEDRRASGGEIVSLVYHRGQILQSVRQAPPADGGTDAEGLRRQVSAQHRRVIRSILHGRVGDPDRQAPDPVPAVEPTLIVSPLHDLKAATRAALLVLLRDGRSFRPIPEARLSFWLNGGQGDPLAVHDAATDGKGFHLAEFDLPDRCGDDLSLHLEACFPEGRTEARLHVLPNRPRIGTPPSAAEPLEMIVSDLDAPRLGAPASLLVLVRRRGSCLPVGASEVHVDLVVDDRRPTTILEAHTDPRGFLLAEFDLPAEAGDEASVIVQAEADGERCEWVLPVRTTRPSVSDGDRGRGRPPGD